MTDLDRQLDAINNQLEQLDKTKPSSGGFTPTDGDWWSVTNAMTMSSAILIFGLVVLVLATYLIKKGIAPEAVLRIFGTILIIVIASFLVVAGYSDQQISPVIGLLGTLAGYLLGKETKENKEGRNTESDSKLSV